MISRRFDMIDGNFAQIIPISPFIQFPAAQFTRITLALNYAKGHKFPPLKAYS